VVPDGRKIAFAASGEDEGDIWLTNPDGTGATNLTHGTVTRGNYPTWSPDGRRLAITAPDGIWIINRDGSGLRKVVTGTKFDSPAWAAAAS
jgi:Tol biopolymer transport system component